MTDAQPARLSIPDTGKLITLAAADSLACLLLPGVPVHIPDAALHEATVSSDALGVASTAESVRRHGDAIRPLMTRTSPIPSRPWTPARNAVRATSPNRRRRRRSAKPPTSPPTSARSSSPRMTARSVAPGASPSRTARA
jgi:hypothetical protein